MSLCRSLLSGALAAFLLSAQQAESQKLDSLPLTVSYAGIGPITWTPIPGLNATLAVPHFSSGPRVLCQGAGYQCEINVEVRNITYYTRQPSELVAEVKAQFQETPNPPPANAVFQIRSEEGLVAATFEDRRPQAAFRFQTMALVMRGAALYQIDAEAQNMSTIESILQLALNARLQDVRFTMAYRFGQFVGACNERVPLSRETNERALAASPFTDAYLLTMLQQRDSTMTPEKLRALRDVQRPQFVAHLDTATPQSRDAYCNGLPALIANEASGLKVP